MTTIVFWGVFFLGLASAEIDIPADSCYSCSYKAREEVVYGLDYAGTAGAKEVCAGPIEVPEALTEGPAVGIESCDSPCYVRYNQLTGVLTRGCYKGQLGVDPSKRGCNFHEDGRIWCFCQGTLCNDFYYPASFSANSVKENNKYLVEDEFEEDI